MSLTDRDIEIGDRIGIRGGSGALSPYRWTPIHRGFMMEVTCIFRMADGTLVGGVQITQTGHRVRAETYRYAFISGFDGSQWNTIPRFDPTPKLKRIRSGRYYGLGQSHSYLIERDRRKWSLIITRTIVWDNFSAGEIQITDSDAWGSKSWHGHLATARTVAIEFEQLGDDYKPHEHGYRDRHTEAIVRVSKMASSVVV